MNKNIQELKENIKLYGNKNKCYKPYLGACCYPMQSQDFVRTGFMDIVPTLAARDYKDPKWIITRDRGKEMIIDNLYLCRKPRYYSKYAPCLTTECGALKTPIKNKDEVCEMEKYRVRRLTPKECGRLMNVEENDIDNMLQAESNSQNYKAFGNSIVVSVLMGIFSQMGIQGVKKWSDSTDDEIYEAIYKDCVIYKDQE